MFSYVLNIMLLLNKKKKKTRKINIYAFYMNFTNVLCILQLPTILMMCSVY